MAIYSMPVEMFETKKPANDIKKVVWSIGVAFVRYERGSSKRILHFNLLSTYRYLNTPSYTTNDHFLMYTTTS